MDLEKDEITDLLESYNHKNVKSIGYERLSYAGGSCFCDFSKIAFTKDTRLDMTGFSRGDPVFEQWKASNITNKLKNLNDSIRAIRPDIMISLHTSLASGWGHEKAN